jgi:nucleoid-associated protein YgaU
LTRENKIALVIGFAILMVVGVLLSDHLAQTVRGDAANLASISDPAQSPPGDSIEFLALVSVPKPEDPKPLNPEEPEQQAPPMHEVRRGETLSAIARQHYGDAGFAEALARYNRLPDPGRLKTGLRLLVPDVRTLHDTVAATLASNSPDSPAVSTPTMQTYRVQSGDTLSELAQKLMGTAKATDRLWALNRSTLDSPDALQPGMELRYPATP